MDDLVCVNHAWVLGPFITPQCPEVEPVSLAMILVVKEFKFPRPSSKKLLDTGFKFKYNLEDMYDGAIACCKQYGLL
ncbi:PREDICTED: vestitone reductase-like [Nicotiana attenuata]|uniref:vestitone reductase-like n=1 Tax=Nicotiana attenuata TaxID=49451 RepID=UPI000905D31B|nr:PREDICTED: vestitone reductase-like [Nicotiana attenuata]